MELSHHALGLCQTAHALLLDLTVCRALILDLLVLPPLPPALLVLPALPRCECYLPLLLAVGASVVYTSCIVSGALARPFLLIFTLSLARALSLISPSLSSFSPSLSRSLADMCMTRRRA